MKKDSNGAKKATHGSVLWQIVDKTNEFRQFTESFSQRACAFDFPQKLAQWRARSPPRAPQSAKTSSAFLFLRTFFFAPLVSKKKVANEFVQSNNLFAFGLHSLVGKTSFQEVFPNALVRFTPFQELSTHFYG